MLLLSAFWLHCTACHLQNCSAAVNAKTIIQYEGMQAEELFARFQQTISQCDYSNPVDVIVIDPGSITLESAYESTYDGFDPYSTESFIMFSMFQNLHLDNSIVLAQLVDNELEDATKVPSHGIKQGAFVVLKETNMPSILVETGYLSNEIDEKLLLSTNGQNSIGNAILNAIQAYKFNLE